MKKRPAIVLGGVLIAMSGAAAFATLAVVSGLNSSDPIVSLGAHVLQEGTRVRTNVEEQGVAN